MNKIKGFKITINRRNVFKYYKGETGPSKPDPAVMDVIDRAIRASAAYMLPALMYETYSKKTIPATVKKIIAGEVSKPEPAGVSVAAENGDHPAVPISSGGTVQLSFWEDCVAVSLCAVSLTCKPMPAGTVPDDLIKPLSCAALDAAVQFAAGLIRNEAEGEDCGLAPHQIIEDIPSIRDIMDVFDFSKIQLSVDDHGTVTPPLSRFILMNWVPKR